jgi:hypothetical protein
VTAIAGDDPSARLRAIDALKPTWAAPQADAAGAPVATVPATTAPRPTAPSETAAPAITDHRAEYDRLEQQNPFAAAAYAARHPREIFIK